MAEETKCYPDYDETLWLRSCQHEIVEPIQGQITGTIPKWLNGDLIRNGPGTLMVGDYTFQHVFDSLALLRKFSISNGEVTYQCKFLESEAYKTCTTAKRIVMNGFGTKSVPDPCHTIFDRVTSIFVKDKRIFDNSSISLYPFDDQLYAFGEAPVIHRINKETLDTEERVNINNTNFTIVQHTPHPHVAKDGTVYNLAMSRNKKQVQHSIVCFPVKAADSPNDHSMFDKANLVTAIPVRWPLYPSYMHSFGITDNNYFIIIEQPWSLSVPQMMLTKLTNEPVANCFTSFKNEMTQFNVINRRTGKLSKFYSKAFFYFHIINQYEVSNHIVLDVSAYNEALGIHFFSVESLKNLQSDPNLAKDLRCRAIRFVLPLLDVKDSLNINNVNLINIPNTEAKAHYLPNGQIFVEPEELCNIGCELPRINYENYSGKEYRYFYALCVDIDAKYPGMLIKVDTKAKTTKTWYETNCYASEPVFVSKPESKEEDDGILLAGLLWGGADTNHVGLVILDAKTMAEIGRAEFHTPSPIPNCLHGMFIPDKNFKL